MVLDLHVYQKGVDLSKIGTVESSNIGCAIKFSGSLLILFFSLNGHLIIFDLIFKSFELVPIGSFYNFEKVIEKSIQSSNTLYHNAVIIVLPIVSILFFMNLGIGFITKSAPQLNLFSFGFPLTILGTFFALYFSVDALQFVFSGLIDEAIGYLRNILEVSPNG